jgi:hypothetical protein
MYDYFQTIVIFGLSLRLQKTQVCSQLYRKNFTIGTFVKSISPPRALQIYLIKSV